MLIDTTTHKGFTIETHTDDDSESPRDWDNLGTMVLLHGRYDLPNEVGLRPDDFEGWSDIQDHLLGSEGALVILPVWMIDHSGVALRTGASNPFHDPWDSGMVGFIFATREAVRENWGETPDLSIVEKVLEGEVETYSAYLNGEVYGYVVTDPDGDTVDSCWGFYDTDDAMSEAQAAVEYHVENVPKVERGTILFGSKHTALIDWLADRGTNDAVQEATGCTFGEYMKVRNGLLSLLREEVPKYALDSEATEG